jgi:hypothetical protein
MLQSGMVKTCTVCKTDKDEYEGFHWKVKSKGIKRSACRVCMSTYYKTHYRGDRHKVPRKIRNARRRANLLLQKLEYLTGKKCISCPESDPILLDFDHENRDNKEFSVSAMISAGRSWNIILVEIAKCVIRCVRCHRKRTAQQMGWYKHLRRYHGAYSSFGRAADCGSAGDGIVAH